MGTVHVTLGRDPEPMFLWHGQTFSSNRQPDKQIYMFFRHSVFETCLNFSVNKACKAGKKHTIISRNIELLNYAANLLHQAYKKSAWTNLISSLPSFSSFSFIFPLGLHHIFYISLPFFFLITERGYTHFRCNRISVTVYLYNPFCTRFSMSRHIDLSDRFFFIIALL